MFELAQDLQDSNAIQSELLLDHSPHKIVQIFEAWIWPISEFDKICEVVTINKMIILRMSGEYHVWIRKNCSSNVTVRLKTPKLGFKGNLNDF